MKTSKPISTISYNSPEYLIMKLKEGQKACLFSEWYFIGHLPEDDEKKEHIHLFIMPSKLIQTDDLVTFFAEYDPQNPAKPKTCPLWRSSKFDDWFLYSKHDAAYLLKKMESRRYAYSTEDFLAYDDDAFEERVRSVRVQDSGQAEKMLEAMKMGWSWTDYVRSGNVPPQAFIGYKAMFEELAATRRGSHKGHEEVTQETEEML